VNGNGETELSENVGNRKGYSVSAGLSAERNCYAAHDIALVADRIYGVAAAEDESTLVF
jgi:hypothetical protein